MIRGIDGASFYELVTGKKGSLKELYSCIPTNNNDQFKLEVSKDDQLKLKNYLS
ncbi:MAG TPA: hypothetical protein DDY13_14545 [Cytophagales bacterium]|nr:hypothetical protein [Cytophagales bacterium]